MRCQILFESTNKSSINLSEQYYKTDLDNIVKQRENIKKLQKFNLYPKEFDFPLLLQFELTSKCNVHCKHCYNNSGITKNDTMTPEKWKDFCKYVVSKGGIFECIISGGEPLLLKEDLFEIMDILHADGTFFLLITNGYLLTQDIVNRLAKYRYKWIQISIDGSTAKYHDEFRQKEGSWDRAVKGAMMVSGAGLPLTIAHSVSKYNLHQIDDMCDLAYSLGAGSIIIGEISLSGRTYENKDLILNDSDHELFLKKVEYNYKKYSGKMFIQRSMNDNLQYEKSKDIPAGGLIIRPNGDIRLDCMVPFKLGNILKEDFAQLWMKKRNKCWQYPEIKDYFENNNIRNYVDNDVLLK